MHVEGRLQYIPQYNFLDNRCHGQKSTEKIVQLNEMNKFHILTCFKSILILIAVDVLEIIYYIQRVFSPFLKVEYCLG